MTKMQYITIGEKMEKRFKSRAEVASILGIPRRTFSSYNTGQRQVINPEMRKKLYDLTGIESFRSETPNKLEWIQLKEWVNAVVEKPPLNKKIIREIKGDSKTEFNGNRPYLDMAFELRNWFNNQNKWNTKQEFADHAGIPRSTMKKIFLGMREPKGEYRRKLYEITQLECFKEIETNKSQICLPPETKKDIRFEPKKLEKDKDLIEVGETIEEVGRSIEKVEQLIDHSSIDSGQPDKQVEQIKPVLEQQPVDQQQPGDQQQTEVQQQTDEVQKQADEVKQQVDEVQQRTEEVQQPTEEVQQTIEEVQQPTIEEVQQPTIEEVQQPTIEEVQQPIIETSIETGVIQQEKSIKYVGKQKCEKVEKQKKENIDMIGDEVDKLAKIFYSLARALEPFKRGTPEQRRRLKAKILAQDLGYVMSFMKAMYDEDSFTDFMFFSEYKLKGGDSDNSE